MFTIGEIGNDLLESMRNEDNIKIKRYDNSNRCYIFFSSHAIYYPNTIEVFDKVIVEKDRYEWERLATSQEIVAISGMHIFVRDIYKQWYVDGINNRLDSIHKLLDYLKTITEGYEIITVGNSAGGYIATIAAHYLEALACFNFAGQVALLDRVESNQLLKRAEGNINKNVFFDTRSLYQDTKCRFYYFYAKKNLEDCKSFGMIAENPNVYGFGFKQKIHGVSMLSENMIPILCSTEANLNELACIYGKKSINRWEFLIRTTSIRNLFRVVWKKIYKECISRGWLKIME